MEKLHLVLLVHAHQPVGNFDSVIESACDKAYLPFLECLRRHPQVRVGLHYSGVLLEWLAAKRLDFFEALAPLVERNQVELVGGGFYEPILVAIPFEDRIEQIRRLADFLEKRLGRRPAGAWLAERVWEPQLPSALAVAGVEYTLVDDNHFLHAGFEPDQLHGYYVVEDLGASVKVIPGLQKLRYLIPFRSVEDNIEYLKQVAAEHPGGLAAFGDDCEKFGVWPGTHEHCYTNGWLDAFFGALGNHSDWLAVTPPAEYLATHPPLGRAYLPTASYNEMMEWALPAPAQRRFHDAQHELGSRPGVGEFLKGGFWRSFLAKYAEANLLHKKMLHVAAKVRELGASARRGLPFRQALEQARTHLLRAQCNDAYWHGVFGGLYSPHLRTALWQELIRAEKIADAAAAGHARYAEATRLDFDADGREEVYLTSETFAALVKPADGGTLAALDFRPADAALINSLERRVEAAHARLHEASQGGGARVDSIHNRIRAKEENLAERLAYDRWPRHAFRLLLFPAAKTFDDYARLQLEESGAFAGGEYFAKSASAEKVALTCTGLLAAAGPRSTHAGEPAPGEVRVEKKFAFERAADSFQVACDVSITHRMQGPWRTVVGVEVVLNLLAPETRDRYFEQAGQRRPLGWAGMLSGSTLRVVDQWQKVAAAIEAPQAREVWVAPIETVSISEDGFERVYQGSQILALWPVELAPGESWTAQVVLRVSRAK